MVMLTPVRGGLRQRVTAMERPEKLPPRMTTCMVDVVVGVVLGGGGGFSAVGMGSGGRD